MLLFVGGLRLFKRLPVNFVFGKVAVFRHRLDCIVFGHSATDVVVYMLLHRQFAKRILFALPVHHKHEFTLVVVDFVPQMAKHRLFVRFGKFLYQTAGTVAQTLAKVTHVFLDVMHGKIENADAHAAVQQRFPVGSFSGKKP